MKDAKVIKTLLNILRPLETTPSQTQLLSDEDRTYLREHIEHVESLIRALIDQAERDGYEHPGTYTCKSCKAWRIGQASREWLCPNCLRKHSPHACLSQGCNSPRQYGNVLCSRCDAIPDSLALPFKPFCRAQHCKNIAVVGTDLCAPHSRPVSRPLPCECFVCVNALFEEVDGKRDDDAIAAINRDDSGRL